MEWLKHTDATANWHVNYIMLYSQSLLCIGGFSASSTSMRFVLLNAFLFTVDKNVCKIRRQEL